MLRRIVDFSLENRALVVIVWLLVVAGGAYALTRLPIDAVPDITNVQVQVLTKAPALGAVEMEQFVTYPVEAAMNGLPRLVEIRSISRYGLSAVTVVFEDGVDVYFARQLVGERLAQAREAIPEGFGNPEMGPVTTGLGDVFQFTVEGDGVSPMERRTILDWEIAPRLRAVPGVTEVNAWGGLPKQYQVVVDPAKLLAYGLSLHEVFDAVERGSGNSGGGYIERNREQYILRGEGLVGSLADIEKIVLRATPDGTPVTVAQIATVREGAMLRIGVATADGRGETVIGLVQMLAGENALDVATRVRRSVDELQPSLPKGVRIVPYYDRASFVNRVIRTVETNLLEGSILVVAVLFAFLGNVRAGLIVASAIPLSMLLAFTGMVASRISANLMSLGAIDFGLIVDGAVVLVENVVRRRGSTSEAAHEVVRPIAFGVGIIVLVYVPILTLGGIEGKMFRPMAWTVVFGMAGSLALTLTLVPVLASLFLKRTKCAHEPTFVELLRRAYLRALDVCLKRRAIVVLAALAAIAGGALLLLRLGGEFMPRIDEGDLSVSAIRPPSVGISEVAASTGRIERVLRRFPEVVTVVSRSGSPELATDVMGIELGDVFVILKPKSEWTSSRSKGELLDAMQKALEETVPGIGYTFLQPIEMRFNELVAGVRSDIGIKLFGDDLDVLREKGEEIARVAAAVAGAADVKLEQTSGLPVIRVRADRDRCARYGVSVGDVLDTVEAARAGKIVGTVFEGQRRFSLAVRFDDATAGSLEALGNIPVASSRGGASIPLGQLAEVALDTGPSQISREAVKRRIVVELNVRGRDVASFAAEAQRKIRSEVTLPAGYYVTWGGQFENLQAASRRLAVVVPLALALIFAMLYFSFGALRPALLIYLNVPFAATGGVAALVTRGMPFSISAGVGFIALFGVAVLNGLVLVTQVLDLEREPGTGRLDALRRACALRMRPVLMTALVASLGFVPMALATGSGAEVQRPLATVVIGGLVTSTLLTLFVLPVLYAARRSRD
ncbi:MAG TPA: CusA/CzcA family heavy metal efflux RND transporter [Candidatus Polarisedimenticolaceae bacterium]|nr:CusA/CzcA family heavy metal efflux RND transporter [Candidatus Polarisedimenticolaceae bacterium]